MRGAALVIAATVLVPAMAQAEGFSSGYVTGFNSDTECMDLARTSMDAHFRNHGGTPDTGEASFSVFGFDVPPGRTQVAIICTEDQGRYTATVTGYSLQEDGTRLETVEAMLDLLEGVTPTGSK